MTTILSNHRRNQAAIRSFLLTNRSKRKDSEFFSSGKEKAPRKKVVFKKKSQYAMATF